MTETDEDVLTPRQLVAEAEALVREAEAALAAATDPTEPDVLESELRETLALQDEVLTTVRPGHRARGGRAAEARKSGA